MTAQSTSREYNKKKMNKRCYMVGLMSTSALPTARYMVMRTIHERAAEFGASTAKYRRPIGYKTAMCSSVMSSSH